MQCNISENQKIKRIARVSVHLPQHPRVFRWRDIDGCQWLISQYIRLP